MAGQLFILEYIRCIGKRK